MMPSSTRTTERFRQDKGAGSTLNLVPGTLDSRAPSVRETTDTSPTDSRYRLLLAMLSLLPIAIEFIRHRRAPKGEHVGE